MKPNLKLVYFEDCPNAKKVRANLILSEQAFKEVDQDKLPDEHPLKLYSSPSILLGETLLFGSVVGGTGGCSLEVPSSQEILDRMKEVSPSSVKGSRLFASTGSFGSILAVILCPVCKPALAALFASFGLGFLANAEVMHSVLILFLVLSTGGFFFSYLRIHRNPVPFVLSIAMAIAIYLGRYVYFGESENNILTYSGIVGLALLSVWNFTLKKPTSCGACPKEARVMDSFNVAHEQASTGISTRIDIFIYSSVWVFRGDGGEEGRV